MRAELTARVATAIGSPITEIRSVGGGDINDAFAVTLGDGRQVFVKTNAAAPPGLFAAEAHGLGWLAGADAIRVPAVLAVGDDHLVLEWLERGPRKKGFDEVLGRGLARLHRTGAPGFGLERDNFIATLAQVNAAAPSWPEFWITRRIAPGVRLAIERRGAPDRWLGAVDRLAARLPTLAPTEAPARLHGDLWHGNVHAAGDEPALIDPAVYGGHREVDLAMLALFGGLSDALIGGYQEVWPLAAGWRERLQLWQLYPLLVHVVLFGGGYAGAVESALERFAG
jgi:fructosamine-3-kinase